MNEYIIEEIEVYGKTAYKVMCHYPYTEPDTHVMTFHYRENAELFCKALNAENEDRPAKM